jgi:hypothetical protein
MNLMMEILIAKMHGSFGYEPNDGYIHFQHLSRAHIQIFCKTCMIKDYIEERVKDECKNSNTTENVTILCNFIYYYVMILLHLITNAVNDGFM